TPARAPELSIADNPLNTGGAIETRKIAVLIADGVDEEQVAAVKAAVKAAGARTELVAATLAPVTTADGKTELRPDKSLLTASSLVYDAVFVPGGSRAAAALRAEGKALHFINEAYVHGKAIGAASEGLDLLLACDLSGQGAPPQQPEAALSLLPGVVAVRSPKRFKKDVAERFVAAVAAGRHFDRQQKRRVPA